MMFQNLRPMEIVLIVGILVLLFGAKKLPQLAKSVGESLKILKTEVGDDKRAAPLAADPPVPAAEPAPAPDRSTAPGHAGTA